MKEISRRDWIVQFLNPLQAACFAVNPPLNIATAAWWPSAWPGNGPAWKLSTYK
jgi:hypothetical protein